MGVTGYTSSNQVILFLVFSLSACSFWPYAHISIVEEQEKKKEKEQDEELVIVNKGDEDKEDKEDNENKEDENILVEIEDKDVKKDDETLKGGGDNIKKIVVTSFF